MLRLNPYTVYAFIDSLSEDGELMLTILASFAQAESKSVSDNCKWRIRKDFSEGKPVNLSLIHGHRQENGRIEIDPEEAAVVCRVFSEYLQGKGTLQIALQLQREGVPRRLGGQWTSASVREMLMNEKYTGDALLQKTYCENHLTKKKIRNHGELTQYYAENTHPAIIDRETFERAQMERAARWAIENVQNPTYARYLLSGRVVCGNCGAHYNRRTQTNGRGTPRRITWQCVTYSTKEKAEIIEACSQALRTLNDTGSLEHKVERLQAEQDMVYGKIESLIHENAQVAQDQEEYNRRMEALYARCKELKSSMAKARNQIMDRAGRSRNVEAYLQKVSRTEPLIEFDESVFTGTVDCVIVRKGQGNNEKQLIFRFKDGTEIPMTI